jgi:thioredoxin reductase
MSTTSGVTVGIIGAGPYGLAIAAHLKFLGIGYRIFGSPMRRWLTQMPKGMLLKSESCASSLFDPTGYYTLAQYCADEGILYPEYGTPVTRELFGQYALSFQRKIVPNVEEVTVASVDELPEGFGLQLSSGERLRAEKVIVATGADYMQNIPEQIAELPKKLRSHTADHYDFSDFRGKEVVVVGGGQSALETAALLRETEASVRVVVRQKSVVWNSPPIKVRRSLYERLRSPRTSFGDGPGLWVYDNLPGLFHLLPLHIRLAKVKTALGPAGAWWLKDRVVGKLPILLGYDIRSAETRGGQVALGITDESGQLAELLADHVIVGTGYRFKVKNLPFLSQKLKLRLRQEQQSPQLSSNFESSVPGLYFTGLGSANAFGPAMRFLAGADYPAQRISRHLARTARTAAPSLARPGKCIEF